MKTFSLLSAGKGWNTQTVYDGKDVTIRLALFITKYTFFALSLLLSQLRSTWRDRKEKTAIKIVSKMVVYYICRCVCVWIALFSVELCWLKICGWDCFHCGAVDFRNERTRFCWWILIKCHYRVALWGLDWVNHCLIVFAVEITHCWFCFYWKQITNRLVLLILVSSDNFQKMWF